MIWLFVKLSPYRFSNFEGENTYKIDISLFVKYKWWQIFDGDAMHFNRRNFSIIFKKYKKDKTSEIAPILSSNPQSSLSLVPWNLSWYDVLADIEFCSITIQNNEKDPFWNNVWY